MKRIPQKFAVQTLCQTIGGLQPIRIVDYDTYDALACDADGTTGTVIYEGATKDFVSYKYAKYHASECHGVANHNGVIVIKVYTKYEQY